MALNKLTPVQTVLAAGSAALVANYVNQQYAISSDLSYMYKVIQIIRASADTESTYADFWEKTADRVPNREFIVFEGRTVTYKQAEQAANKVANWLLANGYKLGDCVALLLENTPEYIIYGLGCAKVGVVVALINTNLRNKSLVHSIQVSGTKTVLFGPEFTSALSDVKDSLAPMGLRYLPQSELESALASTVATRLPKSARKGLTIHSTYSLTYTSGTTGLPKAAELVHFKQLGSGIYMSKMYNVTEHDRLYVCLPLYHSAAGAMSTSLAVSTGATMILKRKFSASSFVSDIRQHKVTLFQYIGELCRYLLSTPETPLDGKNSLRIAFGNGLRADIWEKFQKRFNIPFVGELYAGTEHNVSIVGFLVDQSGVGRGSFGRTGAILQRALNARIAKFDVEKEELIRDKNGFCSLVADNEVGELLGRVNDIFRFYGYHNNEKETSKKVIKDVFEKGDCFYRTGDLIKRDSKGYLYFVDRIGDTFRWKGENVSTNEVMEALTAFQGLHEANVYGVSIPGKDGRAGMAAVVMDDNIDLAKLGEFIAKALPQYAVPLFLRKLSAETAATQFATGTFKYQKVALRSEGFDPNLVKDPVFMFDQATKTYVPFGPAQHEAVISGKAKL